MSCVTINAAELSAGAVGVAVQMQVTRSGSWDPEYPISAHLHLVPNFRDAAPAADPSPTA